MRLARLALTAVVLVGEAASAEPPPSASLHARAGLLAELDFDSDSSRTAWQDNDQLGHVAAWAVANVDSVIVVEGHADRVGPIGYNVNLSAERAMAVRRYLISAGVSPEQIVVVAYGEDGPQRGSNRRVAVWGMRGDVDSVATMLRGLNPAVVARPADLLR